jgi:3-hydroxybutyryl-CoA dehydrogenase
MDIQQIAVIGAGQMGGGIAQVAAQAGLDVVLIDVVPGAADSGKAKIAAQLEKQVAKGKLQAADRDALLARIHPTANIADAAGAQFAVEAIVENEAVKRDLFQKLDQTLPKDAVLATNTSSIPITRIAASTKRPEQVIGMHFMNPVPVMQLVELIRGAQTSDATYEITRALATRLGKTTVVARDFPGFIVNRILIPMINEACFTLHEGLGTAKDIDQAMKLGCNMPMGPLELADFIGLDTCLYIAEVLHKGLGDDKYRPSPLLRQYVDAGWYGRKSGRGFHKY